jgi:hypothetical protein
LGTFLSRGGRLAVNYLTNAIDVCDLFGYAGPKGGLLLKDGCHRVGQEDEERESQDDDSKEDEI